MHERQPELERAIGGGSATQYSMRSPASLEALRAERGPVGHPLAADACVRMRRAVRADGVLGDARSQVVDDPGHNGEGRHRAALLPAPAARRPQEVQDGQAYDVPQVLEGGVVRAPSVAVAGEEHGRCPRRGGAAGSSSPQPAGPISDPLGNRAVQQHVRDGLGPACSRASRVMAGARARVRSAPRPVPARHARSARERPMEDAPGEEAVGARRWNTV